MMMRLSRFNIYLCMAAAFALLATGCKTDAEKKDAKEKAKEKKETAVLELHMEVSADGMRDNEPVPIFRADPMYVNVARVPMVDTRDLVDAKLMEEEGGAYFIRLKFNARGQLLLDTQTTMDLGRRVAVLCTVGLKEPRWLASPVVNRRIVNGEFNFTPDATKDEAKLIVKGLNNVATQIKKDDKGWFDPK